MDKVVESILSDFDKDPEYAMVKYSVPWSLPKTSPHFNELYTQRTKALTRLKWLVHRNRRFKEDLLCLQNLYLVVSSLLNLSCDCCSAKLDLKPLAKFLTQELTKKHYSDLHSLYFLAFLKIADKNVSQKEFSPYVQKMSDHVVAEYNKTFKD